LLVDGLAQFGIDLDFIRTHVSSDCPLHQVETALGALGGENFNLLSWNADTYHNCTMVDRLACLELTLNCLCTLASEYGNNTFDCAYHYNTIPMTWSKDHSNLFARLFDETKDPDWLLSFGRVLGSEGVSPTELYGLKTSTSPSALKMFEIHVANAINNMENGEESSDSSRSPPVSERQGASGSNPFTLLDSDDEGEDSDDPMNDDEEAESDDLTNNSGSSQGSVDNEGAESDHSMDISESSLGSEPEDTQEDNTSFQDAPPQHRSTNTNSRSPSKLPNKKKQNPAKKSPARSTGGAGSDTRKGFGASR